MDPSRRAHGAELREEGVGELVKRLAAETNTLVHQEIELAKAELTEKGKTAGKGAAMFGGAGVVGLLALGALTACFIAVLATALDHVWLAALIGWVNGWSGFDRVGDEVETATHLVLDRYDR